MNEGKVLPFRGPRRPQTIEEWLDSEAWRAHMLTTEEALAAAKAYLETPPEARTEELTRETFSTPEIVLELCRFLREQWEASPPMVAEEASSAYRWLVRHGEDGLRERFRQIAMRQPRTQGPREHMLSEELSFFLGETALLAGGAYRHLGKLEEAERWLDRADAGYRHTINAAPYLASVAYVRLALRYYQRRYEDVLELLPSLVKSFEREEMGHEVAKCRLLECAALKLSGRGDECFQKLQALKESPALRKDPALLGQVYIETGEHHASRGNYEQAMACYQKAFRLLREESRPDALANLKWVIGETFRVTGKLEAALESFRDAQSDFVRLGMALYVAHLHLAIAETLLAMEQESEAAAHVLAALPTIEQQQMIPEAVAAAAILRESVRRQKANPEALRKLREHFQPKS